MLWICCPTGCRILATPFYHMRLDWWAKIYITLSRNSLWNSGYLVINPFHMLRVIWIKSHSAMNLYIKFWLMRPQLLLHCNCRHHKNLDVVAVNVAPDCFLQPWFYNYISPMLVSLLELLSSIGVFSTIWPLICRISISTFSPKDLALIFSFLSFYG